MLKTYFWSPDYDFYPLLTKFEIIFFAGLFKFCYRGDKKGMLRFTLKILLLPVADNLINIDV